MIRQSTFEQNIDEINFARNYFAAIQRGSPEDLDFIKLSLAQDPKKLSRHPSDKALRSNMSNYNQEFPLYIASKNNHIDIIHLLHQGDPFCRNKRSENTNHLLVFEKRHKRKLVQENCLQVAARWGNLEALQLLLSKKHAHSINQRTLRMAQELPSTRDQSRSELEMQGRSQTILTEKIMLL